MGRVSSLWRYPIKAIGREEVTQVGFIAGQAMPGDRVWAVAHQNSKAEQGAWASCGNFLRACNSPTLQATEVATTPDGRLTLTHPKRPTLHVDPNATPDSLLAWLAPLFDADKFEPTAVISVGTRGMTDAPFPSVTLCNLSSHRALEGRAGMSLSIHRWRGNIWLDGLAPWEEFDWIGKELQIGEARFRVEERTGRCKATHANPENGLRDVDVLGLLEDYGHTDFSVQVTVVQSGIVQPNDKVVLV